MVDERLRRLEFLLNELLERQRIARLDTIMFLAYPLVLSILTIISNLLLQYETLRRINIVGVTYASLLVYLALFFGSLVLYTFFRFIRAYVRDDLKGRFQTCLGLLYYGLRLIVGATVIVAVWTIVGDFIGRYATESWVANVMDLTFFGASFLAMFFLLEGASLMCTQSMISWFQMNVPRRLEVEKIGVRDLSKQTSTALKRGKIAWFTTCGLYGVIIFSAVCTRGLEGTVLYHMVALLLLTMSTVIIILRKAIRQAISHRFTEHLKAEAVVKSEA